MWNGQGQTALSKRVHPGGRTALELQGFVHFLRRARAPVYPYGAPVARLPTWFRRPNSRPQLT
jgi:hypothetical protein